ncbi:MAG: endopeptidase La [Nitrospiraceae bacterium]|nr:endopeptidase La [Nitrospiraceae bacterium]
MDDQTTVATLPVLPIKRIVLFPGVLMPVTIGRTSTIAAMDSAMKTEDKTIIVVSQRSPEQEHPSIDDLYSIGTKSVIKQVTRTDGSKIHALIQGIERAVLLRVEQTDPYLTVRSRQLLNPSDSGPEIDAMHRAIVDLVQALPDLIESPGIQEAVSSLVSDEKDPVALAYRVASFMNLTVAGEQELLEAQTCADLLRGLYAALSREMQILQLRNKIAGEVEAKLSKSQREYILREQLKTIHQELGEDDSEENELSHLRKQIEESDLPEAVRKEANREMNRLSKIPPAASDYHVIRSYLEMLLELPWTKASPDQLDLANVRNVLDEDHYGIKEVKERIVEHLAVLKLNPEAKAPILCLVGPPGVGKTSLGQSIARALGRAFQRFSLGGVHDEAELRGHRRTYVGALPGGIIQAIRRAGFNNPVLMLDEVDKMGRDFRGDPAAAMLEILDPAQNHTFRDHYIDLPFDLSNVFFITTANTLDSIAQPLLDRMEIIRLPGYSEYEKLEIANRYLWPRRLKESGLENQPLNFSQDVIGDIIRKYTREAGVRQLEQMLGRVTRKIALQLAEKSQETPAAIITVTPMLIEEWLGTERFMPEEARKTLPAGVATGLAWTPAGGDVLYVETTLLPGNHDIKLTGQLGDVMQESVHAARSYLWAHAESMGLDISTFKRNGVHVHVPSGAVPKDGPSAGITMATALASAYLNMPVRSDTAMTGEMSLSGLVLPVGGIKEKVLAAHRAGIHRIILPKLNQKDLKEIPDEVLAVITFLPVERIDEVLPLAFSSNHEELAKDGDHDTTQHLHETHTTLEASGPTASPNIF